MEKKKNIVICVLFSAILAFFCIAHILVPDKDISYSERRRLKYFPELSANAVFSGDYAEDLESYLLDQFP